MSKEVQIAWDVNVNGTVHSLDERFGYEHDAGHIAGHVEMTPETDTIENWGRIAETARKEGWHTTVVGDSTNTYYSQADKGALAIVSMRSHAPSDRCR